MLYYSHRCLRQPLLVSLRRPSAPGFLPIHAGYRPAPVCTCLRELPSPRALPYTQCSRLSTLSEVHAYRTPQSFCNAYHGPCRKPMSSLKRSPFNPCATWCTTAALCSAHPLRLLFRPCAVDAACPVMPTTSTSGSSRLAACRSRRTMGAMRDRLMAVPRRVRPSGASSPPHALCSASARTLCTWYALSASWTHTARPGQGSFSVSQKKGQHLPFRNRSPALEWRNRGSRS